ncbi:hypothetical protein CUMW_084890 [Citrus unshiu]|nr:hypothetical protein CUMW_084890 [Citrus unshiu]
MIAKCSVQSNDPHLFQTLNGLRHIAETRRFKAWLLDQFGVLHDGKKPYPVEMLATTGAKMVVISNSSRRASTTIDKLKSLGFDPSLFAGAITSGELTHQYLLRRDDTWFAALGRSCIHMTWSDRGAISLEGLGLKVVENVEEADFILAHGTLASKFEKLGGEVRWMGKPDKIIYKSAMAMVGVDACDSIAVGDSLHHDIKGANAAGIQSVFITGGIHATELGLGSYGEVADLSSVQTLVSKYDAYPSYVLPSFTW